MNSPAPNRKPGHSSTTYTLAPPPPPPNWSQTPTPGAVMPYPYSYPQPAQTMAHHMPSGGQPPPRTSPHGPRRGSNASSTVPPPKPLGLPENRDFFSPPTITSSGKGSTHGSAGRITPQNDPHRRGMYIPGQAEEGEGSESGDEQYGLEDDPWGDERPSRHQRSNGSAGGGGGGIMGAVASYMGGGKGGGRKTDEELEREAEREREESRREAERIIAMERAQGRHPSHSASSIERHDMEEEVLRMLGSSPQALQAVPLAPAPASAPPTPGGTPSKSPNTGNPSWWTAAKARLTPNKDKQPLPQDKDLTPAQQIALETRGGKLRKQRSSSIGASERGTPQHPQKGSSWFSPRSSAEDREKKHDWPAKGDKKYDDPAFALLNTPGKRSLDLGPPTTGPHDHQRARTQSLPPPRTPQQGGYLSAPGTPHGPPTTGPQHPAGQRSGAPSPAPSNAPSFLSTGAPRSPYLSHTPQGILNVPESVLSMAARLEKLERWTVAHVRALEDRMREVEEYIVGREGAWDDAEQGVRALRSGLADLRVMAEGLKSAQPPAPEDTELGRAINTAWRKEHGLADGAVPAPRESKMARVVSSVKSTSDDDLRAMAQAQRAELASKTPPGVAKVQQRTVVSNITRTTVLPASAPAMVRAQGGKLAVPNVPEVDRVSLTGLADTLTDYSKMFLAGGEGEADVSRNTSLARSDASGSAASHHTQEDDGAYLEQPTAPPSKDQRRPYDRSYDPYRSESDMDAEEQSIASDATEAAHSLHSGSGSAEETAPRTPPPGTGLPLPGNGLGTAKGRNSPLPLLPRSASPAGTPLAARGHLPRPLGDYIETPDASPAASPNLKVSVGREEREREQAASPMGGRKRYTAALGGKEEKREREKPLLPTPDTPGTEKFEPSPEKMIPAPTSQAPKLVRPKAQRSHTTSYSVSTPPVMPAPSPAPSTNSGSKKDSTPTTTTKAGEFFTTTRPRPRPHSTYAPLTTQAPAPIKIPPTHTRHKQVGLGFVDPLVIRKEVKEAGKEVVNLQGLKEVRAGKKTAKVGEMVKFFDMPQQ